MIKPTISKKSPNKANQHGALKDTKTGILKHEMNINKCIVILLVMAVIQLQTGCASYRTISDADSETAKILSGTRLDVKSIQGDMLPTKLFKSKPPSSPILDLPFSFALDILLLPLTTSAVVYYAIF